MAIATEPQLTFADYLALPEEKRRYEILDGVLVMPPPPSFGHNVIADNLTEILRRIVRPRRIGYVVSAPCDVLIKRDPLRTRQPDVLFISKSRMGDLTLRELLSVRFLDSPPELVIEILSPSNRPAHIKEKLGDYCAIGVNECWLVDPMPETVEVLRLSTSGAVSIGTFQESDAITSEVLTGLFVRVAEIFE